MHMPKVGFGAVYPLRLTVDEACHELRISRSQFYRKQKKEIKGYPVIRKDDYRSFVNTAEVLEWVLNCPVWGLK